jgi:hypothetical protein
VSEPPAGQSWLRRHVSELIVALISVVAGALIQAIFLDEDPPRPPPLGTIDVPQHDDTVAPQADARGRLRDIPADKHVWLAAQRDGRQWATPRELSHDPDWAIGIPREVPRGQPLKLVLFVVGSAGNERLRTAHGGELSVDEVAGTRPLAIVPTFYVRKTPPLNRLHAVFPQSRESGGEDFRFAHGGRLDASFPDDPTCHRPERAVGLQLHWDMSGEQDGGWGVAWRHNRAPLGRFDASDFDRVSFSVKGKKGGEIFEIGLKDTSGKETKIQSEEVRAARFADEWTRLVIPLDDFKGVDQESIENVNVGFTHLHGRGTMCIDEIRFE